MQALRFHGIGDLRLENLPVPRLTAPNHVRLKILAAGICGSDLHNYRTGQWVSHLPVTPGHEFAAEVLECADSTFQPGDLVIADSRVFCGACPNCRSGRPNLCPNLGFVGEVCDGGFAEQTILPAHSLFPAPASISPAIAAMAEPLAVALHAVRRLAPLKSHPILIAGGGPIGGLIALLLAESNFGPLYLIERNPHRAALLSQTAGTVSIPLADSAIREACAGGPPFCIDATGSSAVVETLIPTLAPGGRLALVGIFHGGLSFTPNQVVERELDILGCSVFQTELPDAIALLPALAPKLAQLSSRPIPLSSMQAAYDALLAGQTTTLKTIMQPN